jgi:alkaline phosphatase D
MTKRPSHGSGPESVVLPRRKFLSAVVAVATGPSVLACNGDPPAPIDVGRYFPQSVASGDPRPESVVLWTRYLDPEVAGDAELELELATDEAFDARVLLDDAPSLSLTARADADYCVKVRVESLEPATTYYYRFSAVFGSERRVSQTGRTRTAPAPDADRAVRFAVVSCQDYGSARYHVLAHLAEQELDFVLHLGDYVYETTGDPAFQEGNDERQVVFGDVAGAIDRGGFFAARSLDNYRDLYRIYRGDRDLQRLHELFPMIAVWDDHEFSNDCHGAVSTYLDGRESEEDLERRRHADQAFFEYMPIDYGSEPSRALDETAEFPDDFAIHRSFVFGRHVELVMTDLRRYRPDHVVPEDAFPGAVFATDAQLSDLLGELPDDAVPYLDVTSFEGGAYRDALRELSAELDFDADRVTGMLSIPWINATLESAGVSELPAIDEASAEGRGYAYYQLLKTAGHSSFGARYLVAEAPFRALAALRFAESGGDSERLMGVAQRAWFVDTLRASTRTYKIWGNQFTLMPRVIDLSQITIAPPEFQRRLLLSAEDWDGAPNEREALLSELAGVENVVVFSGDIHAFFAGAPHPKDAPDKAVIEFVCGSVSSTTWATGIEAALEQDPNIPPGTALLARSVGTLLVDPELKPNPHLGYADLRRNGCAIVEVDGDNLAATLLSIEPTRLREARNELGEPLDTYFEALSFRVPEGSRALERSKDGSWERWDPSAFAWV